MSDPREEVLAAAAVMLTTLGCPHEVAAAVRAGLELGYAIGTSEDAEALVPAKILAFVKSQREQQRKREEEYRSQPGELAQAGYGVVGQAQLGASRSSIWR